MVIIFTINKTILMIFRNRKNQTSVRRNHSQYMMKLCFHFFIISSPFPALRIITLVHCHNNSPNCLATVAFSTDRIKKPNNSRSYITLGLLLNSINSRIFFFFVRCDGSSGANKVCSNYLLRFESSYEFRQTFFFVLECILKTK